MDQIFFFTSWYSTTNNSSFRGINEFFFGKNVTILKQQNPCQIEDIENNLLDLRRN